MKRVMKFSLLFDDDVDDDDDICFYMRVLCALFMRYVRLKFCADFSSHKTAKNTHIKNMSQTSSFFFFSLKFAYTTQRERERDARVRERVAQIVPEMQREEREERESKHVAYIDIFLLFEHLFSHFSRVLQKKKRDKRVIIKT